MNGIGPGPIAAIGGGTVILVAEVATATADATPLTILAGVLGSVVALLGFVVRRQQVAAEAQAKADRSEREKDREHDRREREQSLTAFRDELAQERQLAREMNAELVKELRKLGEDAREGKHCRGPGG